MFRLFPQQFDTDNIITGPNHYQMMGSSMFSNLASRLTNQFKYLAIKTTNSELLKTITLLQFYDLEQSGIQKQWEYYDSTYHIYCDDIHYNLTKNSLYLVFQNYDSFLEVAHLINPESLLITDFPLCPFRSEPIIVPSLSPQVLYHYLDNTARKYRLNQWSQISTCNTYSFDYKLNNELYSKDFSGKGGIFPTESMISLNPIATTDTASFGTYWVSQEGVLQDGTSKTQTLQITINYPITAITSPIKPIQTPPYFTEDLKNLTVFYDQILVYKLPIVKDDENDPYKINFYAQKEWQQLYDVDKRMISFLIFNISIQVHHFVVEIQEQTVYNLTSKYAFSINVKESPKEIEVDKVVEIGNDTELEDNSTNEIKYNSTDLIKAKIVSVSDKGVVKVIFNYQLKSLTSTELKQLNELVTPILRNQNGSSLSTNKIIYHQLTSLSGKNMIIKIKFLYPLKVSLSGQTDYLLLKFTDKQKYIKADANDSLIFPNGFITDQFALPNQEQQTLNYVFEEIKEYVQYSIVGTFGLNTIAVLFFDVSLQQFWSLINTLQLVAYLPLLNFNMPYNLLQFFNIISQATNLQLVDITLIKEFINPEGEKKYDQETIYSTNFQLMGFSSSDIYENMGPELFLFFMNFVMYLLILFTKQFKESRIFKVIHKYLVKKFVFDFGLRLVLELYLYYCVIVGLQYQQYLNYPQFTRFTSLLMTFPALAVLALFPILNLIIIMKRKTKESIEIHYSSLIEDLRATNFLSKLQRIFFICRRILFVLSIFILKSFPAFQVFFNQLTCILEIIYIIKAQPFSKISSNRMEILNNVLYLFICTGFLLLTDEFDQYSMKVNSSWAIMSMIAVILVSNIAIIILSFVEKSMRYLWNKRRQFLRNRKMKQIINFNESSTFMTTQTFLGTNTEKSFFEVSGKFINMEDQNLSIIKKDKKHNSDVFERRITNILSINFKYSDSKNQTLEQIDEVITDNEDIQEKSSQRSKK
ncbi:UNKNOWN [Stylonychia lemnae]|uniref:TRP C-terminal domain-containing protein n=1 Tax=Stylonychia lemnae TaxID=5949 RepID=A0A078AJ25_STYLE|nr:UNKNOWN [Stylonychia lemnae]|eukprot:CDW80808.1 UNKNOWN [Stylonychia lemnae]